VNPKLQKKVLTVQGPHGAHRQTFYVRPGEEHQLQFRKHSPVDASESSTTPRDRAEVHYGLFWSKTANKGIDHALESIGKVHAVPKNLLKIPIKVTGSLGGANGMYWTVPPHEINVSKYAFGPASTAAHEYGHFLDHHLFGSGKPNLTGMGTLSRVKNPSGPMESAELHPLMAAIYKSHAVKKLVEKHDDNEAHGRSTEHAMYLLMPPELFARAYAQWIGQKSSAQIRNEVRAYGDGWRRYGYHAQWEDKDFEPIAKEFDRLFAGRRLLRGRSE
jgi:hypothetical protein